MSLCDIKSKNFLEAIRRNRTKEVEARLAYGQDVGEKFMANFLNRTGLHCAISYSHVKMVEILLGAGADLSQRDSNGNTSLHVACSRSGPDSLQIVRMLLGSGQSLPLQMKNKFNRTALDECVLIESVENAKLLLSAGASVEESTKILVSEKNNAEMIMMMESYDINFSISVKDERENPMKRIAELETQLIAKKQNLQKYRSNYAKSKKKVMTEIMEKDQELMKAEKRIEQVNKQVLDTKKELHALRTKMRKITIEKQDLSNILQCPVCLDNCKPPLQIWQCREGHILCESCFSRPELKTCPQCRMSLQGNVSRSRVLEELAMKLFPHKVKTPRKLFPHKVKTPRQSYRNHLTIAFPNNGRNRRSPL